MSSLRWACSNVICEIVGRSQCRCQRAENEVEKPAHLLAKQGITLKRESLFVSLPR